MKFRNIILKFYLNLMNRWRKARLPAAFAAAYPGTPFSVVTPDNYPEFLRLADSETPIVG